MYERARQNGTVWKNPTFEVPFCPQFLSRFSLIVESENKNKTKMTKKLHFAPAVPFRPALTLRIWCRSDFRLRSHTGSGAAPGQKESRRRGLTNRWDIRAYEERSARWSNREEWDRRPAGSRSGTFPSRAPYMYTYLCIHSDVYVYIYRLGRVAHKRSFNLLNLC